MKNLSTLLFLLMFSIIPLSVFSHSEKKDVYTEHFPLEDCNFSTEGGNAYFILSPGRELAFNNEACVEEGDCDEEETLLITVLNETREITFTTANGVELTLDTRVVEEFETADGEIAEISHNFFAACDGDVYYFGEEVWVPDGEGGLMGGADGPGAWLAGENGALPGIIFPGGAFLLGARYFQEIAEADEALDRAEHMDMGLDIEVPAGNFENCVQVNETTPLDKKELSTKIYCPGIGLVIDDDAELESYVE